MRKFLLVACAMFATAVCAAPPYDVSLTVTEPTVGEAPDGYNFYINDCAATGPTAAPFATDVTPAGQTFTAAVTTNGSFVMCVRSFKTKADPAVNFCEGQAVDPAVLICETADPGNAFRNVDLADIVPTPFPAPADDINITISGGSGSYTVTITPP